MVAQPRGGWFSQRSSLYVLAVLGMWTLFPELRRLIDWKIGFNSISVISVVPLLALVPPIAIVIYTGGLKRVDPALRLCAWIWFGGFTFSLAIAGVTGNAIAGLYTYAEFCLPAGFALWIASLNIPTEILYERVAKFLLFLALPVALYGAFQFVRPPAWDVEWMQYTKITSIGVPLPFQLRPFSTLNGPGIFGDFLVAVIALNLPRLRAGRTFTFVAMGICSAVLILTMVRSAWVGLAVAVLVFIICSPHRGRNITMFTAIALVCGVLGANASTLLGSDDAGNGLANRFSTFTDLSNDVSFNERSRYFEGPLVEAARTPLGLGLGDVGTAAKLGAAGQTQDFDDGYIARFTEMGYFGTACYLLAIGTALALTIRRWRLRTRQGRTALASIAAASIALQSSLIFLDVSSDHHNALAGLFFWLALGLGDGGGA